MRQRLAQFSVGAAGYSTLEVLARGHTHWTMAVLGGICLCALCAIAHSFAHKSIVFRGAGHRLYHCGGICHRPCGEPLARLGRVGLYKRGGEPSGAGVPAVQLLLVLPVLRRVWGTAACAAPSGGQSEHLTAFSTLQKRRAPLDGPPSLS